MKYLLRNTSKSFADLVYAKTKLVPRGRVATYGQIAKAIGRPGASRAVGNALNCNPYAPVVPCHRVVRSNGRIGGFAQGTKAKAGLLRRDGVKVRDGKVVDFKEKLFCFE
ncbi:MAG: MGMT family protein [Candidatus Moraniibacteriota bacterium]